MTKHEELLKYTIDENLDNTKIELIPQLIDNTIHIHTPNSIHLNTDEIIIQPTKHTTKTNTTTIKTRLEKAMDQLYNVENNVTTTESVLNIDLDLYQMEDY
ncbi:MAG: hypothetical protein LBC03_06140 [Nitrososphaerota archaeon]|nr:hypothetical protein [Nitrososphaerota archaeon]